MQCSAVQCNGARSTLNFIDGRTDGRTTAVKGRVKKRFHSIAPEAEVPWCHRLSRHTARLVSSLLPWRVAICKRSRFFIFILRLRLWHSRKMFELIFKKGGPPASPPPTILGPGIETMNSYLSFSPTPTNNRTDGQRAGGGEGIAVLTLQQQQQRMRRLFSFSFFLSSFLSSLCLVFIYLFAHLSSFAVLRRPPPPYLVCCCYCRGCPFFCFIILWLTMTRLFSHPIRAVI